MDVQHPDCERRLRRAFDNGRLTVHLGFVHVTQGKLHPHGGATDTASSKGCSEGILCTQPALKWGCDSEMGAQSPGRWTPPGHRGQGASHPEALGGTGVVFTLKVPRPLCTFENVVDKTLMSKNFARIEPPHVQAWLFLLPVSSGTVRRRWALEQVQEKRKFITDHFQYSSNGRQW